jgi:phosphoglycerol transferase MdoB-like AlkP superfamily enzyme
MQASLLAALTPSAWVALAVIIAVSVAARRRAEGESIASLPSRNRWLLEATLLLLIPVVLLIVAQSSDPAIAGRRDDRLVTWAMYGVVAVQLVLGSALIWRHRQRWLATVVITIGFCWWTLGASFMGYMALTDNWL